MTGYLEVTLYVDGDKNLICVSLEVDGKDHCTSDIRESREGKDTFIVCTSRTTLNSDKHSMHKLAKDCKFAKIEVLAEVEFFEIKSWGMSTFGLKAKEIANYHTETI